MPTANEVILNESVQHAIDLQGYSNNVVRRMLAILAKADVDLIQQLEISLNSLPLSQFNFERLELALLSVRDLNARAYASISSEVDGELQSLTAYEADYQKQLYASVLPSQVVISAVSVDQVYAAAMARPFSGRLLKEWMFGIEVAKASAIRDAVRMGYLENQTIGEIVKRVRGTKALNFRDGILEISRRNAEGVIITAIGHTSNFANNAFLGANSDVVKGYRYTATLDLRTTVLCAGRDGKFYALGGAKPAIPAHFRCRSRYVGVTKSFRELGIDLDELPPGTRQSLDGQVPSSLNYNDWLKKQSQERQDEVLGKSKAEIFRRGEVTLDKFVSKQGHTYTIEELRAKYHLNG